MTKTANKMDLRTYYKGLRFAHKDFLKQVSEACGVTESAVEKWVYGIVEPGKLEKEIIARIAGIHVSKLFPEDKK